MMSWIDTEFLAKILSIHLKPLVESKSIGVMFRYKQFLPRNNLQFAVYNRRRRKNNFRIQLYFLSTFSVNTVSYILAI